MSRLLVVTAVLLWTLLGPLRALAFGLDDVAAIAAQEAAQPYRDTRAALPPELANLDYDALRDIRYRPERAVWRDQGLPFELQFFHLGRNNLQPVQINQIVNGQVLPIHYDPERMDLRPEPARPQPVG